MRALRGFGTLLVREAARLSRRRGTWLGRLGYAALVVWFCFAVVDTAGADSQQTGQIGRRLFEGWAALQLGFVLFLAPLAVASGVQEERDAGTFDLLLLSGLSAAQVLWGQVAARLLSILALLAAGLPVLALVVSFGGISPWEVVNAGVGTVAAALSLGSIAGFFALFIRSGPVLPALAALAWTLPMWWVLPALRALFAAPTRLYTTLVPVAAPFEASAAGLLVLPAALPTVMLCAALGVPVFRMLLTDDSDEQLGLHSPDVWVLERFKRWLAGGVLLVGLATPPTVLLALWLQTAGFPGFSEMLTWFWLVGLEAVGTLGFLLAGVRVFEWVGQWRAAFGRRGTFERPPPVIRFNPVWWRETRAQSLAGARWLVRVCGICGVCLVVAYFAFLPRDATREGTWPVTFGVFTVAGLLTPLLAALVQMDERRARTLPMLLVTGFPAWRIAAGRLAVVWTALAPWTAIGFVAVFTSRPAVTESAAHVASGHVGHPLPPLFPGWFWPRHLFIVLWVCALITLLASVAMAAALRVRTPRMAWATTAALYPAIPLLLVLPSLLDLDHWVRRVWWYLWFPFSDFAGFGCFLRGVPSSLWIATGWMLLLCGCAFAWFTREIRTFQKDVD